MKAKLEDWWSIGIGLLIAYFGILILARDEMIIKKINWVKCTNKKCLWYKSGDCDATIYTRNGVKPCQFKSKRAPTKDVLMDLVQQND